MLRWLIQPRSVDSSRSTLRRRRSRSIPGSTAPRIPANSSDAGADCLHVPANTDVNPSHISTQTEQTTSLTAVQKNSRAGRLPVTPDEIDDVLRHPPRLLRMVYEDPKTQSLNQSRETFLWNSFALGPACSTLEEMTRYVAFLSCQPSTFSSYATHIRNLAQNNLPLN